MGKNKEVIVSWNENAGEWIRVIDESKIQSRRFTNQAIVQTLRDINASKFLDIGCGEGWLTREISGMGKTAIGIDAIPAFLENARKKGPGTYYCMNYEEIIAKKPVPEMPFDVLVFNFCLYGKDGLVPLLRQSRKVLKKKGKMVIQTLHPLFLLQQGLEYKSQWIDNAWNGLPGNFTNGHAWYARTLEDWMQVINRCRMKVIGLKEVTDQNKTPISMILTLQK